MDKLLSVCIETSLRAGEIILGYYNSDVAVSFKEDRSPLTKADVDASNFIVGELKKIDASIPIVTEEDSMPAHEQRKAWREFWLVDPLDGTAEFIDRLDEFTVNIALIRSGEPILGVVYAPAKSLLYYASKGQGSWKKVGNAPAVRIFSKEPRRTGKLSVVESRRHGAAELEKFLKDSQIEVGERVASGSSIKFCLVAEGVADIYPRMGPTMEWDVAAGDCIYRNSVSSGSRSTTLTYNKHDLKNGPFVIGM